MVRFLVAKRSILLQHRALYIFLWLLSKQCLLGTTSLAVCAAAKLRAALHFGGQLCEPSDDTGRVRCVQRALQLKNTGLCVYSI